MVQCNMNQDNRETESDGVDNRQAYDAPQRLIHKNKC